MNAACQLVTRNKGAAGVDGMRVEQLKAYLQQHWSTLKQPLMDGTYHPQPERKVEIPKPSGVKRMLGIPTITDRLNQQAIHQILSRRYDPHVSPTTTASGRNAVQRTR